MWRNTVTNLLILVALIFLNFMSSQAHAQASGDDVNELEDALVKEDAVLQKKNEAPAKENKQQINYSDIKSATPFSDLAIVQKNYMPKTGRQQINIGVALVPSDIFFNSLGADIKWGYHFDETWGLEFQGVFLGSSKSKATRDLENKQFVGVDNLVQLKSFLGASVYFSSVYGKTALWDRSIFPFEIYQTVGAGIVQTGLSSSAGLRLALGELFTLNKNNAVRLEISALFYNAKNINGVQEMNNSLFLTLSYEKFLTAVRER
jgi:outer membrane beta-barrel protein